MDNLFQFIGIFYAICILIGIKLMTLNRTVKISSVIGLGFLAFLIASILLVSQILSFKIEIVLSSYIGSKIFFSKCTAVSLQSIKFLLICTHFSVGRDIAINCVESQLLRTLNNISESQLFNISNCLLLSYIAASSPLLIITSWLPLLLLLILLDLLDLLDPLDLLDQ